MKKNQAVLPKFASVWDVIKKYSTNSETTGVLLNSVEYKVILVK